MKKGFLILVLILCGLISSGQKVIFLHHSTGQNLYTQGEVAKWISDYNTSNGTSYQITERSYPNTPYPWQNYPYDYWYLWINGHCDNSDPDIECMDKLTQNYDVIIFKHCFPGADIIADDGNPSVSSAAKTLANYKLQYRALRTLMDSYPNTKFIVWTLVPEHRLATNAENAARSREFVNWVKTSWLTEDGKTHKNIYIFDFFGYAAESNPTPANGQVNCLKYEYELSHTGNDSHPNTLANQTIGPIFAQFIVNTIKNSPMAVDDVHYDNELKIFPNPAKEIITVDLAGVKNKTIFLDIIDLSGNIVHHEPTMERNSIDVDLKKLIAGTYIVRIMTESSSVQQLLSVAQ